MGAFIGPTRKELLQLLRDVQAASKLPVTLGLYAPQAVVVHEDGRWMIRPLVVNQAARDAAYEAASQKPRPFWVPESEFRFLEPGPPSVVAETKREFIRRVKTMRWPYGK